MRILDLSHQLRPGKEEYILDIETRQIEELYPQYNRRPGEWYIIQKLTAIAHVGTHIESPFHHRRDGRDISGLDLADLVCQAIVVDFTHKKPNEAISREEMRAACERFDLRGKVFFLHTGRDKFYHDERHSHERQFPAAEAVEWLVEQGISCFAVDATGIEVKGLDHQPNHDCLFAAGIPLVENVTNLDRLSGPEFFTCILPINIVGLESCPVRVIAIEGLRFD